MLLVTCWHNRREKWVNQAGRSVAFGIKQQVIKSRVAVSKICKSSTSVTINELGEVVENTYELQEPFTKLITYSRENKIACKDGI